MSAITSEEQTDTMDDRTKTPTISVELDESEGVCLRCDSPHADTADYNSPEVKRRNRGPPGHYLSYDDNYIRYQDNDTRGYHDNSETRVNEHDVRSWCGSISDISQCSSRPISLCVKYNDSEDNLLAIESDLEELEHESNSDTLQRHFHNSKLSDLLDLEQEDIRRRRSMSALPSSLNKQNNHAYVKGNESPVKSHVT